MAFNFTAASNQYLNSPFISISYPFTIAGWIFPKTTGNVMLGLFQNGGLNNRDRAFLQLSGTKLQAQAVNEGFIASQSNSLNDITRNDWNHCAGIFSSTTQTAYLNSSAGNVASGSVAIPNSLIICINAVILSFAGLLITQYGNASYAEVGIWNAALTAAEIASLAKGMTCDKVRPQSLVFYAPLVRDLIDQKGGLTITNNNGATVANHTRVYA
jgi:hypothetical protein